MNKQNRKGNAANKQNECNAASGAKEHVKIFDGFVVQIVRDMDGYEDIKTDYISRELFDSCIRTGYLTEITETVKMAVNA
mgnify:CR=1 FL=1